MMLCCKEMLETVGLLCPETKCQFVNISSSQRIVDNWLELIDTIITVG